MWNMERSIAWAERREREARSTNLTNASLQQTSGLTRPAGLVLVHPFFTEQNGQKHSKNKEMSASESHVPRAA